MTDKEIRLRGLTGEIIALERGSPHGVPLVTLHGWLDNAASFDPLARCLVQYRWVSIDLPGHGKSAHRPDGCIYHFTDYVADLHCVVRSLQLDECNLVGHSLGAGIAAMFAASFPHQVDRLVLIDGIGPISGEDDDSLMQIRKSMAFLEQKPLDNARGYSCWDDLIDARLDAGKMARSSAGLLLRRGAQPVGDKIIVRSDRRLKQHSPIYMNQRTVLAILGGIQARTLLVLAKDGMVAGRKSTRSRIDAMQNIDVKYVDGHHHVHMDHPQRVAEFIEHFMRTAGQKNAGNNQ